MATMKDVAQLAGVSTATVSRALMNPEKVSSSTRKRVEEAVLEAGYSPNSLARNLRRNESKTIVAIVPDICDPYFSEIIRGIEDAAMEHGYLVLLGDSGQQKRRENSFVNLVFTKQADGMLLLGTDLPFDVSKPEQKNLPPMVMACEFAPELELPTVHIDNLTSAFEAVNYLTQLGHKRIAQISGPQHAALCQFRHQGYQQALRRAGITMNPTYCTFGDFTFEAGQKRCVSCWHCLSSRPRFSVITIRWRLAQFRKRSDLACAYRKISPWSVLTIFSLPSTAIPH